MKAIVCADNENNIGYKNQLLLRIPEDMKYFKSATMNHTIIMGKNTFLSMGGRQLPGREMVVLSKTLDGSQYPFIKLYSSIANMIFDVPDDSFVIGGGQIYAAMMDYVDEILVTRILATLDGDTKFPELPKDDWNLTQGDTFYKFIDSEKEEYLYRFDRYTRKKKQGN